MRQAAHSHFRISLRSYHGPTDQSEHQPDVFLVKVDDCHYQLISAGVDVVEVDYA